MSTEPKQEVARHSERQFDDRDSINKLLDSEYVAHVGFIDPETQSPYVIPMGFARDENRILIHGSTGSRIMMLMSKGVDVCITVTKLNAIVVARSAFNSSMNYESVMIFGKVRVLLDAEKEIALEKITNKLIPGLWEYGRGMNKKEAAATMIVELAMDQISAKSRTGDPIDEDDDLDLGLWAGLIPLKTVAEPAVTARNAQGIPVPSHLL
jgi:nitroimidazol reductase NimA-like FMN-containing flavoprotein (pyridoxamine 5'-phosphate oxidase superfamily)